MNRVVYQIFFAALVTFVGVGCGFVADGADGGDDDSVAVVTKSRYGVLVDGYAINEHKLHSGETMASIMGSYGRSAGDVDRVDRASRSVFALRDMRAGNRYVTFVGRDSAGVEQLDYIAYERDRVNYVLFVMCGDSVSVQLGEKPQRSVRQRREAVITSSLLGGIVDGGMPYALGGEIERIYQWSIDLFSIQRGDKFVVIYDERFVDDSVSVGLGEVRGVKFTHKSRDYYAIPFDDGDGVQYWDERGRSLRMNMLMAPLPYSRVTTTRSSHSVVNWVKRSDDGVYYAAPTGTPVVAVSDGVVIFRGREKSGGRGVRILHQGGVETGYFQLSRFSRGLKVGDRVVQGGLVGYVGARSHAKGSYLDYRVLVDGESINPLDIEPQPMNPISEANIESFESECKAIVAELNGKKEFEK